MRESELETAARWARLGEPFVSATITHTGGSTPRLEGAQMWVSAQEQAGTVGGGAFELLVVERARAMLSESLHASSPSPLLCEVSAHLTHELGMCCGGKMTALLRRYDAPLTTYLLGAGHVSQALARQLSLLDRRVVVIDERAEWADPSRFPDQAEVRCEDPEGWLRLEPLVQGASMVILTHDHGLDERLVALALPQRAQGTLSFLGLIGSEGKWGRFKRRLRERGAREEELSLVRCPVGLPIKAQTPAEIALSVAAELTTLRYTAP